MEIYSAPVYRLNEDTELKQYWTKYIQLSRIQSKRLSELETYLQSLGFLIQPDSNDLGSPSRGRKNSPKADFAFKASTAESVVPSEFKKYLLKSDKYGYRAVRKNSQLSKIFEQSTIAKKTLDAIHDADSAKSNMRFAQQDLIDELYQVEIQGLQNINGELYMHVSSPEEVAGILSEKFTEVNYDQYVKLVENAVTHG